MAGSGAAWFGFKLPELINGSGTKGVAALAVVISSIEGSGVGCLVGRLDGSEFTPLAISDADAGGVLELVLFDCIGIGQLGTNGASNGWW